MTQVKFKWISRAKFNALASKDVNTLYFIFNEHVFYKGDQQYGGIQDIDYTVDTNGNYEIVITKGDGTTETLNVAGSNRLETALNNFQDQLEAHIASQAGEEKLAHVRLTDRIDGNNPTTVASGIATTPKSVVDYVKNYQGKSFLEFPSYLDFPSAGMAEVLYLAIDTGYLWRYNVSTGGYEVISDTWKRIEQINGTI